RAGIPAVAARARQQRARAGAPAGRLPARQRPPARRLRPRRPAGGRRGAAAVSIAPGPPPSTRQPVEDVAGWVDAIVRVAAHYRIDCSREGIAVAAQWNARGEGALPLQQLVPRLARQAGLAMRWVDADPARLTSWRLPLVVQLRDGQVGVVTAETAQGLTVSLGGDGGLDTVIAADELRGALRRMAVLRPARSIPDQRVDDYIRPFDPGWLRQLALADLRPYRHVMLASLVANTMALAGILFSMQVYDRVVPAQSMPTLYVLFGGVVLATLFAYAMRQARMRITDVVGKRADLRISDRVFGHALRVRNS